MKIEVQLPDGSIAEFPEGTPPEVMQAEIEKTLGGQSDPRRNPDPTREPSPRPDVSQRLQQGQRGGGASSMPIPRSMSTLPEPPAQDQAPQSGPVPPASNPVNDRIAAENPNAFDPRSDANVYGRGEEPRQRPAPAPAQDQPPQIASAGQPDQGPQSLLQQMNPAQRAAFDALPPDQQAIVLGTGAPSAEDTREPTNTSSAFRGGDGEVQEPYRGPYKGEGISPLEAINRYEDWEAGNAPHPEARSSAAEAARIREQNGTTSARGSMGDNITQGNPAAAAAQADQARAGNAPGETAAPSATGEKSETPNLAMPRGLSVQDALQGENTGKSFGFSMGDGSTVQIGTAPRRAMRQAEKSGLDFLMERSDKVIEALLAKGDIAGATEFRAFVRGENAQAGMKSMNTAIVAANYGDSAAFTAALSRMATSLDGDGQWEIDTAGTKLNEVDGEAVGATISMRNKDTGEITTREFEGMQGVISAVSDWASPTAAFERQQARVTSAQNAAITKADDFQEAYDKLFEDMYDKDSFVDLEGKSIGQDEMANRHQIVIDRIKAVRPDLMPSGMGGGQGASGAGAGAFTGGSNGQPVPTLNG